MTGLRHRPSTKSISPDAHPGPTHHRPRNPHIPPHGFRNHVILRLPVLQQTHGMDPGLRPVLVSCLPALSRSAKGPGGFVHSGNRPGIHGTSAGSLPEMRCTPAVHPAISTLVLLRVPAVRVRRNIYENRILARWINRKTVISLSRHNPHPERI